MRRHRVERRLVGVFIVTAGTILSGKLPFVWIRRVAIRAQSMRHGFFEITGLVAFRAFHFCVPAVQGEIREVMVKTGRHPHHLPAHGGVTAFARALKCAAVRILMAIKAGGKWKIRILRIRLAVYRRQRTMALVANYLFMQSGKGVAAACMIKFSSRFPTIKVMAPCAIGV